ncbi:MAG: hypothetical protein ACRD0E_02255 [Acidimicrobiales bacterium]
MLEFPFNDTAASAFLEGRIVADDAPPGYQDVANLILSARAPAVAGELVDQDYVVARFAVAVMETPSVSHTQPAGALVVPVHTERRPRMFSQLLSAKVAAAATVAVLGSGTLAAAVGALPASMQASVAGSLSHVGISVPNPDTHGLDALGASLGHEVSQIKAPQTPAPSTDGRTLCAEFAASNNTSTSGSGSSTGSASGNSASSALSSAAQSKGETVQQYCATFKAPSSQPTNPAPDPTPPTIPPSHPGTQTNPPTNPAPPSGGNNGGGNPGPTLPKLPTIPTIHMPNFSVFGSGSASGSGSGSASGSGLSVSGSAHVNAGVTVKGH